jgi:hypothetical protein
MEATHIKVRVLDEWGFCLDEFSIPHRGNKEATACRALRRVLEDGDMSLSEMMEEFSVDFGAGRIVRLKPELSISTVR